MRKKCHGYGAFPTLIEATGDHVSASRTIAIGCRPYDHLLAQSVTATEIGKAGCPSVLGSACPSVPRGASTAWEAGAATRSAWRHPPPATQNRRSLHLTTAAGHAPQNGPCRCNGAMARSDGFQAFPIGVVVAAIAPVPTLALNDTPITREINPPQRDRSRGCSIAGGLQNFRCDNDCPGARTKVAANGSGERGL